MIPHGCWSCLRMFLFHSWGDGVEVKDNGFFLVNGWKLSGQGKELGSWGLGCCVEDMLAL